jgi:hypothetical protein
MVVEKPLFLSISARASAREGTTKGTGTWFLFCILLLLGIHTLADASDRADSSCLVSPACEGSNCSSSASASCSTPGEPSAEDCALDAENGLCVSDPEAMFRKCSPDEYCLDRENFGAVALAAVVHCEGIPGNCKDEDENCEAYAEKHACLLNPKYMDEKCPKSCYLCFETDDDSGFAEVPIGVEQRIPPGLAEADKKRFYGVIAETSSYMAKEVFAKEEFEQSRRDCRNTDDRCAWWVASTSSICDDPSDRMLCGPACKACREMVFTDDELVILDDCTPNEALNAFENAKPNSKNDDDEIDDEDQDDDNDNDNDDSNLDGSQTIDVMFRRIIGELPYPSSPGETYPIIPGVNYTATVLSRPSLNPKIHTNMPLGSIDFHIGGPWIVVLDDFLSPEECDRLIELGDRLGRKRSTIEDDVDEDDEDDLEEDNDNDNDNDDPTNDNLNEDKGDNGGGIIKDEDKVSDNDDVDDGEGDEEDGKEGEEKEWRTSTTAWCTKETCSQDPIATRIQRRIGLTTGVTDKSYYEFFQLLKYGT